MGKGEYFMSKFDMIIKSNNIFIKDRLFSCNIGIKNDKIICLSSTNLDNAEIIIDASDKLVLPGTIDPHVHIKDPDPLNDEIPEPLDKETFESGSKAAAAGGVTTVIEHPVCLPPPYSAELLEKRMRKAKDQIVVDIAFFGAAGIEHLEHINSCAKAGIVSFKTFLQRPPEGREQFYEGLIAPEDYDLYQVMKEIKKTGLLAAFHAENENIIKNEINRLKSEGKVSPINHARSRPAIAEIESASKIILFAEELGLTVQICHISTPKTVEIVNDAKRKGTKVFAETCPHYLFLTEEALNKHGVFAKCNPPLRTETERQGMWEMVVNGSIDTIGSDHSTHTLKEKEKGLDNIFLSSSGIPGIEERLPLFFTKVKEGKLKLKRMVELLSENPAKIFRLYPRKGTIEIDSDADFVIIDPNKKFKILKEKMFTKLRDVAKLFEGWEVYGKPELTIVRGKVVFEKGEIKAKPGYGKIIKALECE